MPPISPLEASARQLIIRRVLPAALRLAHRTARLAETRFRRSFAIERHVKGTGLEIGAAAAPAVVPLGATVTYVDKYGGDRLAADPELAGLPVRPPDIIASAEDLNGIASASQDFVLAFSVLEHVQDVLGSLAAIRRVTRDGGTLVL